MENTEKSRVRETFSKKSKKVKMWFAIFIEIQRSGIVNKLCWKNLLFNDVYKNRCIFFLSNPTHKQEFLEVFTLLHYKSQSLFKTFGFLKCIFSTLVQLIWTWFDNILLHSWLEHRCITSLTIFGRLLCFVVNFVWGSQICKCSPYKSRISKGWL